MWDCAIHRGRRARAPRRPGARGRARPRARHPDALVPTYLEEVASTLAAACWKLAHRRVRWPSCSGRLPGGRGGDDRGPPGFVATTGASASTSTTTPPTPRGRASGAAGVAGRPAQRHPALAGRRAQRGAAVGRRARPRGAGGLRGAAARAGPGPRRLHLPAAAPLAVAQQGRGHLRPRPRRRDLVHLGESPDAYRAQQSIRTFFNTDRPERHYVKTALAIQNMGFVRGLSPAYMAVTPPSTTGWPTSSPATPRWPACGFTVLRERAAVGYNRRRLPPPHRHLALPQDARGAVAREPAAADRSR